jgi:hypothetical protein
VPNTPAPPNARPAGSRRRIAGETSKASAKGAEVETSASSTSDPARDVDEARSEGAVLSGRSTAASPLSNAGRRDAREACLPRRRGTVVRGLDAAEPETLARAIVTTVDVAPLDVVARRREATASGRAAAVIDAVVAIIAIVAAASSDEGARCFARPRAAKAKAPSTPLARDVGPKRRAHHSREISQLRGRACANPEFEFLSG